MKILFVVPYIYKSNLSGFEKNRTGLGIILAQMLEYISKDCELYVFSNVITKKRQLGSTTILSHSWMDFLFCFTIKNFISGCLEAVKGKRTFRDRLLCVYYKLNCGALKQAIQNVQPDIIHCHGVGEKLLWYYSVSLSSHVPVLMTLHGLIAQTGVKDVDKNAEISLLKTAMRQLLPISVISTGIKERLLNSPWNLTYLENISVIPNGTDTTKHSSNIDIFKKHRISRDCRVCVAVGSVYSVKNQIQIVRAVALIPKSIRRTFRLLILGTLSNNYPIEALIEKLGLSGCIECLGFIDHDDIPSYYSASVLNILASTTSEGFGLSLIEGFVYGVPCVTFADLAAIPDIYDERAMLLCPNRSDRALADTLLKALHKNWDRDWISDYSQNFSLNIMGKRYIELYKQIILDSNSGQKVIQG